ncbi:MAG: GntR family transcriptional regulator [Spirochaetota bacterium]
MKLSKEGRRSYTRQLTDILVTRIVAEAETHDGRVPSFRELAKRYDTSINTVHYAVKRLVRDGILTARAGSGTYLADRYRSRIKGMSKRRHLQITLLVSDSVGNHAWLNPHIEALTAYQTAHGDINFSVHYFRGLDLFAEANFPVIDYISKGYSHGSVIVSPVKPENIRRFVRDDIPIVAMYNEYPGIDCVQTDPEPVYREIMRMAHDRRLRRILVIAGKDRNAKANRFIEGLRVFCGGSAVISASEYEYAGREAARDLIRASAAQIHEAEIIVTTGDETAVACREYIARTGSKTVLINHYDYDSTIGDINIEKASRGEMLFAIELLMARISGENRPPKNIVFRIADTAAAS